MSVTHVVSKMLKHVELQCNKYLSYPRTLTFEQNDAELILDRSILLFTKPEQLRSSKLKLILGILLLS